jgi:hypothetical protein
MSGVSASSKSTLMGLSVSVMLMQLLILVMLHTDVHLEQV